ncbi:hypothetical protein BEWA_004690 [Theileria equi strain WA]|uniref:Uncharacterized protein n=1 Tax=Theileria equi strain WA TaxID=1537102 RepID=L0B1D5_THEEQ|nr:hypothetical protein BEWA_004690 [Theileria equi strain WA]AFZ81061.1 hypothetical protein BEWA_004690 [Theileria equi strain WA]|eukprot:XP_004830727.1 hypothetical protein BEWA_004690 [Theileria equi strain WA]
MHTHCHKFLHNDEDGSEIEFEGWLQLGNPHKFDGPGRCPRSNSICIGNRRHIDNHHCCSQNEINNLLGELYESHHARTNCGHCNVNHKKRSKCGTCSKRGHGCTGARLSKSEEDIMYINNKQSPPTVIVQKPHTVVVRNRSRPPVVVQQPPPNVIVKNDPPQPVYVQSFPPNVTIKNDGIHGAFRNPQTYQQVQMSKPQAGVSSCNHAPGCNGIKNHNCIYHYANN